jgi:hypothetical protein
VYDIRNGLIKDLNVSMNSDEDMPEVYKFEKRPFTHIV